MKKMTKREKFETLLTIPAVAENTMLVEFINNELELLAKKNSGEKKPTAQQTANGEVKAAILSAMESGRLYTITELMKEVPGLPENMSNQRMTAIVRQMKIAHEIYRVVDKRKAYFRLPTADDVWDDEVEGE